MGHVINPISLRLGFSRYWNSIWCLSNLSNYSHLTSQDYFVKKIILAYFKEMYYSEEYRFIFLINNICVLRKSNIVQVFVYLYDSMREFEILFFLKKGLRRGLYKRYMFNAYRWKEKRWLPSNDFFVRFFSKRILRLKSNNTKLLINLNCLSFKKKISIFLKNKLFISYWYFALKYLIKQKKNKKNKKGITRSSSLFSKSNNLKLKKTSSNFYSRPKKYKNSRSYYYSDFNKPYLKRIRSSKFFLFHTIGFIKTSKRLRGYFYRLFKKYTIWSLRKISQKFWFGVKLFLVQLYLLFIKIYYQIIYILLV